MKLTNVEIISDVAYLYSTWCGVLSVEEGSVKTFNGETNYGVFCSNNDKTLLCHIEPEKVYNAMVWLPERNDQKAIDILVQYYEKEINKLKEKIELKQIKIEILRKGVQK